MKDKPNAALAKTCRFLKLARAFYNAFYETCSLFISAPCDQYMANCRDKGNLMESFKLTLLEFEIHL